MFPRLWSILPVAFVLLQHFALANYRKKTEAVSPDGVIFVVYNDYPAHIYDTNEPPILVKFVLRDGRYEMESGIIFNIDPLGNQVFADGMTVDGYGRPLVAWGVVSTKRVRSHQLAPGVHLRHSFVVTSRWVGRFRDDLKRDDTFGENGRVPIDIVAGFNYKQTSILALHEDPEGRLLVIARAPTIDKALPAVLQKTYVSENTALYRLKQDGQRDTTFNRTGKLVYTGMVEGNFFATGVTIMPESSLIVYGYAMKTDGIGVTVQVAKVCRNGETVRQFQARRGLFFDARDAATVALDDRGKLIVLAPVESDGQTRFDHFKIPPFVPESLPLTHARASALSVTAGVQISGADSQILKIYQFQPESRREFSVLNGVEPHPCWAPLVRLEGE